MKSKFLNLNYIQKPPNAGGFVVFWTHDAVRSLSPKSCAPSVGLELIKIVYVGAF